MLALRNHTVASVSHPHAMHGQPAQGNSCGKQQGALASVSIHSVWSPVAHRLEAGAAPQTRPVHTSTRLLPIKFVPLRHGVVQAKHILLHDLPRCLLGGIALQAPLGDLPDLLEEVLMAIA
eukprot:3065768-Alexandrium_andersonii.AAC.1